MKTSRELPGSFWPAHDRPLRRDIQFLAELLNEVLIVQEGQEFVDEVERIRRLGVSLRHGGGQRVRDRLQRLIGGQSLEELVRLTRVFSIYFQLVNLAEQQHRLRRKRQYEQQEDQPQPGSIEALVKSLRVLEVRPSVLQDVLRRIRIELVLTAHPTETSRRTVLEIHRAIAALLDERDRMQLSPKEMASWTAAMREQITLLWQTDELRDRRPSVLDEVRNILWYFDRVLFDLLPLVYSEWERCLRIYYPSISLPENPLLRFGSWVGGDRAGNPQVTPEVIWQTLRLHKAAVLDQYIRRLDTLVARFSQTVGVIGLDPQLAESLRRDMRQLPSFAISQRERSFREPYRAKLAFMAQRTRLTLARLRAEGALLGSVERTYQGVWQALASSQDCGYERAEQLKSDLMVVKAALERQGSGILASQELDGLIRQVTLFDFYLVPLDIRERAENFSAAAREVAYVVGLVPSPAGTEQDGLPEGDRTQASWQSILESVWDETMPRLSTAQRSQLSASTRAVLAILDLFPKAQRQIAPGALRRLVLTGVRDVYDLLAPLWLARVLAGSAAGKDGKPATDGEEETIELVPLFQRIEELRVAPDFLWEIFQNGAYRKYLERRGWHQEVMIDYSDANRDEGYLTGNWEIFRVQERLFEVGQRYGVKVHFLHGRGGAIGRGGGPTGEAILAQPPGTIGEQIRITEQGEVISSKYSVFGIGQRNLEQVVSACVAAALPTEIRGRVPSAVYLGEEQTETMAMSQSAQTKPGAAAVAADRLKDVPYSNALWVPIGLPSQEDVERWRTVMAELSERAATAYRGLVERPEFAEYLDQATPLAAILTLRIGSRPPETSSAIPSTIAWVFAWTQSRHLLPGWYGVGSAIDSYLTDYPDRLSMLRRMTAEWHFWRSVLDNLQMALAKADLEIAHSYAMLVTNPAGTELYQQIAAEYRRTEQAVLLLTGQRRLLDNNRMLQRSIYLRNPYIDPLSFIQVELLRRWREDPAPQWERALHRTINGIAAGLRNSG
ncbi:MAG: phosphoenolpyruvate carboxylase [Limnochordaceae bacterium]|nr:phosphoenolpyruvate carboxylase [Limnochordaceae bacterium]